MTHEVVVDPKKVKVKADADVEWATMLTDFAVTESNHWFQPE